MKVFIDTTVKQLAISGKDISDENTKEKIKTIFLSDSFVKPFAEKLKTFFTDEETDLLLEMYQSDLMAKLMKHSEEIFSTLHAEMIKQVESISQTSLI
ncbi:MAG: hypothetical protein ACRDAI_03295 [Candidatus Rhabdochlamydia sp.]